MSLARIVRNLSAVLAGFQLAVTLVSFFGLTALAKWVVSEWIPFTRWVWEQVALTLNIPDFSDLEKDALTSVAFFLPMAISSVLFYIFARRGESAPSKILVLVIGGLFFWIIGRELIEEIVRVFGEFESVVISFLAPIFTSSIFSSLIFISVFLVGISSFIENIFKVDIEYFIKSKISKKYHRYVPAFWFVMFSPALVHASLSLILILLSILEFVIFAPGATGAIVAAAFISVIVSLILTAIFDAERILVTFGALVAFIASSYIFDAVMAIARFVQDVDAEQPQQAPVSGDLVHLLNQGLTQIPQFPLT